MVTLYYRKSLFNIIVDGKAVDTASIMLDNYQRHSILAIPIAECDRRLPVCGALQADSLRHISVSNNYDYIDLGKGEYELLPLFPEVPRGYRPQVIMQREADGILATIYQDYGRHVLIEDDEHFINHSLPADVDNIAIGYCELGATVILQGEIYLAIFLRAEGDFRLLLERNGGKSEFCTDGVNIIYHRADMMQRSVEEHYAISGSNYQLVSRRFEHTINHKYLPELLPCMLIDALIAEDYDHARSLLAPDLAQNILSIRDFFGKIISFYSIKAQPIANKSLSLLVMDGDRKCVKRYSFEYNNSHIINFSECDS